MNENSAEDIREIHHAWSLAGIIVSLQTSHCLEREY